MDDRSSIEKSITYRLRLANNVNGIMQRNFKNGSQCYEVSFRKAIWPILAVSQLFGVMPLNGISCQSIFDLKFKWKSKRTVYGLFAMTMVVCYASIRLCNTFVREIEFRKIVDDLFCYASSFGFVSVFVLAKRWPELMEYWEVMETNLTNSHNFKLKKSRMLRLRVTAFILLILATVEHSLYLITLIDSLEADEKDVIKKLAETYIPLFPGTYDYMPTWGVIPLLLMAEFVTYVCNFLDLVIIMISMGLTTLFELLNHEIKHTEVENQTSEFWFNMQSSYRKLRKLVFLIDSSVSHIILVSFANDLFLICVQLHELLRWRFEKLPAVNFAYFFYSLVYINIRAFGMAFLAAQIHDESREPMKLLCNIPASSNESNEFFDEVRGNTVALSGMEFFFMTLKLILSVIGTICTYELVLMQFRHD